VRTQVVIIGAGPAGTLLGHLLQAAGIDVVILEQQSRQYVLDRIRAGVLEWGTVEVLRCAGLSAGLDAAGVVHDGAGIAWNGRHEFMDIAASTGRHFMSYGQSALQADLYATADARGVVLLDEAVEVHPHDVGPGARPWVSYSRYGVTHRIDCEIVVGCDGFHGVCRSVLPSAAVRTYETVYPFGWLGILSETPPLHHLVYCNHERGFALASQRNAMLSRYYVQCPLSDTVEDWPDERFWPELVARFPTELAEQIVVGPSIEKSIAPLRSFVVEPLRWGHLFLAGDAAHIVPPTGAKGLNLAVSDAHYLAEGLIGRFVHHDDELLDRYSDRALRRIWAAVRFSWWMTRLLHRFPDQTPFDLRMQEVELDLLADSDTARAAFCEQYAGLPLEFRS
jgi:p-hydroxybenzoate 3-monooxygenase